MAVRFLPPPEDRGPALRDEGENLAQVVEMRSWLRPGRLDAAAEAEAETETEAEAEVDSEVDAEAEGEVEAEAEAEAEAEVKVDVQVEAKADIAADSAACAPLSSRSAGPADKQQGARGEGLAPVTRVRFGGALAGQPKQAGPAAPAEPAVTTELANANRGVAYEDAVRLLARRARSSGELRDDLLALDHSADEVSIVIDEFVESHYLDDIGLARVQSEKLRDSKGASRGQIKRKLRERKLPDDVIEEIIGALDTGEEFELLREAAQKRAKSLNGLDRETAKRRLLGFLARRGWSGEPAMRAVNEALDGTGRPVSGRGGVRFE